MKYKILKDNFKEIKNPETGELIKVYRIQALKDFETIINKSIKEGDLGGFIESEEHLSQEGKCWVFNDSVACGKKKMFNDLVLIKNEAYIHNHEYILSTFMSKMEDYV